MLDEALSSQMETAAHDNKLLSDIEEIRCERLSKAAEKSIFHDHLSKVIILGDMGKFISAVSIALAI